MKAIRKVISLVVVAVMVLSMNGFAEIISYDEAYILSGSEFVNAKDDVLRQIDIYNKDLEKNIDIYEKTYEMKKVGDDLEMLDKVYPVGAIMVASMHPTIGKWKEVLSNDYYRVLWLSAGTRGWGDLIQESWPKPSGVEMDWVIGGLNSHTHTLTLEKGETNEVTAPRHSSWTGMGTTGAQSSTSALGSGAYNANYKNYTSSEDGDHTHVIKIDGTVSPHEEHTHVVKPSVYENIYLGGSQNSVQAMPNCVFLKVWERIE